MSGVRPSLVTESNPKANFTVSRSMSSNSCPLMRSVRSCKAKGVVLFFCLDERRNLIDN